MEIRTNHVIRSFEIRKPFLLREKETNLLKHNFDLVWSFSYIFNGSAFNDWWGIKVKISIINTIKWKPVKFLTENIVVIDLQGHDQPTGYVFNALERILSKGLLEFIDLDIQME